MFLSFLQFGGLDSFSLKEGDSQLLQHKLLGSHGQRPTVCPGPLGWSVLPVGVHILSTLKMTVKWPGH